ncbi:MAG TPA: pitrilysin family protein, partial [Verrucomicrobiae bacterium]|nr:pitrilysin family protein [Verrucomicrobiae bacterium]
IAVYLKVGGRNDPPGKAGLSHFLEHMLFRGNEDLPSGPAIDSAFERIGGSVNAATDTESTCYYSRVHPDHVTEGIRLFSSLLLKPTMQELETEKKIITEEAREDLNERGEEINPDNLSSTLLWPDSTLGMPTVGYLQTIAAIGEEDLRQHLARYYVPPNGVLAVAGRVDAQEVFDAAERFFGGWSGELPRQPEPVRERQERPQGLFVQDSDSQVNLQIAFRGFSMSDPRMMAVKFIRRLLCGGGSSRLHLSLRERLGLVYSVDASVGAYRETGTFAIDLSTSPGTLPLAVEETVRELRRLCSEEIGGEELERVRRSYLFDLEYSRDSASDMQTRYGWGEIMNVVRSVEDDRREALALGEPSLRETARRLFAPERMNLVAVGPVKAGVRTKVEGALASYTLD